MIHDVKTLHDFFEARLAGIKPFEVRRNDRNYKTGDIIHQREWRPGPEREGTYTGRSVTDLITYVLRDFPGVDRDFVVMGTRAAELPPDTVPRKQLDMVADACAAAVRAAMFLKEKAFGPSPVFTDDDERTFMDMVKEAHTALGPELLAVQCKSPQQRDALCYFAISHGYWNVDMHGTGAWVVISPTAQTVWATDDKPKDADVISALQMEQVLQSR